ncbi:MAG TPA: HAMP domain-containing sensor histidine kinase [Verrucomicrobiales bacterium]|nr:HAMP domain-containing sensor histidine kinase [Verrucomicrobiales bacterium]
MRSATLFLFAIFTPCALLCWVSWLWMQDEASVIKRDRTALYQKSVDLAARAATTFMAGQLQTFGETVDRLLAADAPEEMRLRFHQAIRGAFPLAEAGIVLDSTNGRVLPQVEPSEQAVTAFVSSHAWFFKDEMQPLYLEIPPIDRPSLKAGAKLAGRPGVRAPEPLTPAPDPLSALAGDTAQPPPPASAVSAPAARTKDAMDVAPKPAGKPVAAPEPAQGPVANAKRESPGEDFRRTVHPQIVAPAEPGPQSQVKPVDYRLATLIQQYETGIAGHPHGDRLFTLFWYRSPAWPEMTFAVALQPEALQAALAAQQDIDAPDKDTCLALLDHQLRPAARWPQGTTFEPPSWSAPLVARELGPALPRWEASIFLRDPAVFNNAASVSRWRWGIIVTTASLAAVAGAFLILRDVRRAARDARLKTDFVSNVSHELKTPLTSIRMFSDLLGNNPDVPPEKTKRYAEVIAGEAARLTRLINNVLNFSRMESGRQQLKTARLDLRALTAETMEHMRPQLEKDGFEVEVILPEDPVTVEASASVLRP